MISGQDAQYGQDDSDGGFREFALGLYAADGVSRAALGLQDRRGVDVNMLLFAAFIGARGQRPLTHADVEAARNRVGWWQDEVVTPLRAVRRTLKNAAVPGAADLSSRLQEIELAAEFAELDELAKLAPAPQAGGGLRTEDAIREALGATVTVYAGAPPDAADDADIAVLTAGAQR
ncbi:TIGR02444 family protein [Mycobacterium sp. BMJ-28]